MKAERARQLALALPQATEAPHFDYTSFRIGNKIFATMPPGEAFLHVFVDEVQRAPLVDLQPDAYQPLHWGAKVVGIKVTLSQADPATVQELLRQSWLRKAPKRLAAAIAGR
nr:MmcQ/YjbR family DNA-binding protein [Rhodoferax sp.]